MILCSERALRCYRSAGHAKRSTGQSMSALRTDEGACVRSFCCLATGSHLVIYRYWMHCNVSELWIKNG